MVLDVMNSCDEDVNITEQNFITGYYWLRWSLDFESGIDTEIRESARLFFFLQILWNLIFLLGMNFSGKKVIRSFIKIRPTVFGLKYTDSRTDRQTDILDIIYMSTEWA